MPRETIEGVEYVTIDDAADELAKKYGKTGPEIYAENAAVYAAASANYEATQTALQIPESDLGHRKRVEAWKAERDEQRRKEAPLIEARREAKEAAWQQQHYEQIKNDVGKRLEAAAQRGEFPVRNRTTLLRLMPGERMRTFYDLVKVTELDSWFEKVDGSHYRMNDKKKGDDQSGWRGKARERAQYVLGVSPGKYTNLDALADRVAEDLNRQGVSTDKGKPLTGSYVRKAIQRHVTIPKPKNPEKNKSS